MARPRKVAVESKSDDFTRGAYTVSKPLDKYVVRHGGSVVYAADTLDQVNKYLDLVKA